MGDVFMSGLHITKHAESRMRQRSISKSDVDLIVLIGSRIGESYLIREKDYQSVEHALKRILHRVRRLRGKRLVVSDGRLVTAFHATKQQHRALNRRIPDRDLTCI